MDIGSLLIVGVIVTGLVQFLKSRFGTDGWQTRVILVVVSIIGGAVYKFFGQTVYWQALLEILGFASLVYAFIIRPLEKPAAQ